MQPRLRGAADRVAEAAGAAGGDLLVFMSPLAGAGRAMALKPRQISRKGQMFCQDIEFPSDLLGLQKAI